MPDDTLSHGDITKLVTELLPGRDTREVIETIRQRCRRALTWRERRTVIEMCSRLRTWGSTQHVAPSVPDAPVYVPMPKETKHIYDLHAIERRMRLPELLKCIYERVASEDLIDVLCPPVGSV